MTVWAVHEVLDDVRAANEFGQIEYINRYYIHGDQLERDANDNVMPRGYLANMGRALRSFDPATDYLLIAGDHLQLLAFTAMLSARFPSFSVLRYDRKLPGYIPVRLYSGLVPPRAGVLESGTHIGDTEHGESREKSHITAEDLKLGTENLQPGTRTKRFT